MGQSSWNVGSFYHLAISSVNMLNVISTDKQQHTCTNIYLQNALSVSIHSVLNTL